MLNGIDERYMQRYLCRKCGVLKSFDAVSIKQTTTKKGKSVSYIYCKNCEKKAHLKSNLAKRKCTIEKYEGMLEQQKGFCLICGEKPKKLVIDHNHKTGKIRGLLCRSCNWLIGAAKENPTILENAANYLIENPIPNVYDMNGKLPKEAQEL